MRIFYFPLFFVLFTQAVQAADPPLNLTRLSLEELMTIEVTLASRKPEKLSTATAAISVLTADDLRRLGVKTLPEALRWVPGMQVGRIDANKWEVSSRGFSGLFTDKLQVLIDGRSVYTPLFSGVFWEVQDVVLEDVDRIEVIRGPGGTLWGANAVNGVINIITRNAAETQGGWVEIGGGTKELGSATARYGGKLGESGYFRVYGKSFTQGNSKGSTLPVRDGWHLSRIGTRMDWRPSPQESLTLEGSAYAGRAGQSFVLATSLSPPYTQTVYYDAELSGGDLLGRWKRHLEDRGDLELQLYLDRLDRKDAIFQGMIQNADIDFQHRFEPSRNQELIWGLGYRLTDDDFTGTFTLSLLPAKRRSHLFSGFVQDDVSLLSGRMRLTLGTKLEHNSRSGFEWQPNLRLGLFPSSDHTFWGAISRATRTPSRADNDIRATLQILPPGALFSGSPLARAVLLGNRDFASEELLAWEAGYRAAWFDQLIVDLAGFYQRYDQVRSNEAETPFLEAATSPAHLVIPVRISNELNGKTYGAELALSWQKGEWWRLQASYSYLHMDLWPNRGSQDTGTDRSEEGSVPHHQLALRSSFDLSPDLGLNLSGRYVDQLPYQQIDDYLTFDLHLEWRLLPHLTISLVGQNLLDSPHLEYLSTSTNNLPAQVERDVHGRISWEF